MKVKSGFATSEFWMAFLPTLASLLVLSGVVGADDSNYLVALGKDVVAGVVALISILKYVQSRTEIKVEAMKWEEERLPLGVGGTSETTPTE